MLLRARGNLSNYLKTGQNTSINFDVAVYDSFTELNGSSVPVLAADGLKQLTFSWRPAISARVCAFFDARSSSFTYLERSRASFHSY